MRVASAAPARGAISDFCASILVPGLGQWLQSRRVAGLSFFVQATTLFAIGVASSDYRTLAWAASALVSLWVAFDAARTAHRIRGCAA